MRLSRLLVLLMLAVGMLGALMSSTGVVAIFIPIALRIAQATGTPASRQNVGSKSTAFTTVRAFIWPAGVAPGHHTINGSRVPPSYKLNFEPRKPAVRFC